MKYTIAALLAVASLASAQISQLPRCALSCYTQAIAKSTCKDQLCQCTTGAADIAKVAVPCLCQSECTPDDLKTAMDAANKICETTLQSAGQSMPSDAAKLSPDMCKALATASGMPSGSMTGSMSMPTSYSAPSGSHNATGTATGSEGSATGTSVASGTGARNNEVSASATGASGNNSTGTASASASLASSTGAASRMGIEAGLVGLAGLAVLAL